MNILGTNDYKRKLKWYNHSEYIAHVVCKQSLTVLTKSLADPTQPNPTRGWTEPMTMPGIEWPRKCPILTMEEKYKIIHFKHKSIHFLENQSWTFGWHYELLLRVTVNKQPMFKVTKISHQICRKRMMGPLKVKYKTTHGVSIDAQLLISVDFEVP